MAAMDACKACFGRGSVVPARAGSVAKRTWSTKFETRTPRYTTPLPKVRSCERCPFGRYGGRETSRAGVAERGRRTAQSRHRGDVPRR
ncbi:DUF4113 domain-containing protein [Methylobacterium oryzisoli]|uniref:DUF4113 domain-containing protein n=1 Tax=Methylobacterium oryzisoli TaxID=3385502 RepID=UPI003891F7FF